MSSAAMNDDFLISSRHVADDVVLVTIGGDLDITTVPHAKAFLAQATATGPEHLILDLSAVTFLPSSGLAFLIGARAHDDRIHGYLHLLGVTGNRPVERPLTTMALLDLFDIATDLHTLLLDLDRMQPTTD